MAKDKKINGQSAVKKSVSFPKDLLTRAENKAAQEQRSLSNYIQCLLAADLAKSGKALRA